MALEAGFDAIAMELRPGLADLHAGFVSEREGNVAAAQSHYEQARRLDPNGAIGQQAKNMLEQLPERAN